MNLQPTASQYREIGRIRTDQFGHFETTVRLPESLPAGVASVQVVSDYGVLDTAFVTIDPSAPAPPLDPETGRPASGGFDPVPIFAVGAAVAALGFLFVRTKPRPSTGKGA